MQPDEITNHEFPCHDSDCVGRTVYCLRSFRGVDLEAVFASQDISGHCVTLLERGKSTQYCRSYLTVETIQIGANVVRPHHFTVSLKETHCYSKLGYGGRAI